MQDSILLVDDEPNVVASLKRALLDEPYEIYSAGSGAEGLKLLEQRRIKVIISDEMMPGMTGAEFLSKVKERMPETLRIMLTGHASIEAAMAAVNSGEIYRFFAKPWDDTGLKLAIRSALEKYNLETENRRLLMIVKRQALDLKLLERKYPSITKLEKDESGNLILPDMSETEFSEILAQCEKEYC
jgi:DNA-binding NtrC family response regulator